MLLKNVTADNACYNQPMFWIGEEKRATVWLSSSCTSLREIPTCLQQPMMAQLL